MHAATLASAVEFYLYAGLLVSVVFLCFGIDRVSPGTRGAYLFRALLAPGVTLLWPLVLWRWLALERGAGENWRERHAPRYGQHLRATVGLALAVPLILVVALVVRETPMQPPPPERLDASAAQ